MNLQAHLSALTRKHTSLKTNIVKEERRPSPDTVLLMALKKEKLKIKDQLNEYG
ncbi:MAG: YdcH family protein [Sphingomonadales bacterium]|nr:YdcH family protein [Sphingomonadales bacterium]